MSKLIIICLKLFVFESCFRMLAVIWFQFFFNWCFGVDM